MPAILGSIVIATASIGRTHDAGTSAVRVERTAHGWRLLRDGAPYVIRGAGGETELAMLKAAGGNSIRTWGAENRGALLDRAHALGLTVTLGIWLGHERHGFRYDDPKQVAAQLERARAFVRQYRRHPALLIWGVGNEMEGRGDNPAIWKAVNEIARMIKAEDPHHPTMTVVAEIGGRKLAMLKSHCPDIEILGVNSYAGLASLPARLKQAGWDRPYVVTEFGPRGHWEVAKTAWGAPIEPTSTEKARDYLANYQRSIAGEPDRCLGGYAFLWGHKQEVTGTWYGMLLPVAGGVERLGAVDAMTVAWTGKWPANRAPEIVALVLDAASATVAPGAPLTASLKTRDSEGDRLTARWEVRAESADRHEGGDRESVPPVAPGSATETRDLTLRFRAPTTPGPYRLFVTLHDGKGSAATANVPFRVSASERSLLAPLRAQELADERIHAIGMLVDDPMRAIRDATDRQV
jgi:hypothetical protein